MTEQKKRQYQFGDTVRITKGFNMGSESNPHSNTGMVGAIVEIETRIVGEDHLVSTVKGYDPRGTVWVHVQFPDLRNPLLFLERNVERVENS